MPKKTSNYRAALNAVAWLALASLSSFTFAIELGPASVSSPLESPLSASLPLLDSDAYPLDELQVQVANENAFSDAGLEWISTIQPVSVALEEREGRRQIMLSSQQPVTAPWLDLLLTLDSPEGQQTHTVTLLFDPVGYSSITSNPETQDSAVTTLDVLPGDTLWRIAERSKPSEVSIQQMMLALVEANPDLFPAGNINSLRAGQVLAVPSAALALSRSPGDAAQTVRTMVSEGQYSSTSEPLLLSQSETQPTSEQDKPLTSASSEGVTSSAADSSEEKTAQNSAIAELGVQLAQSQASLIRAQEEREQFRVELDEMRHSIDLLKEDMAAQAASPSMQASSAGAATQMALDRRTQNTDGVLNRLKRNQQSLVWGLGLLLIGLLVAGLWGFLRRRKVLTYDDKQYVEGATLAEPKVFRPTGTASEKTASPPSLNIPLSCDVERSSSLAGGEMVDHKQDPFFTSVARSQAAGLAVPLAAKPVDLSETQWEIEEVAFESRGRDNS
ncbi:type IV pilus assembly protein FimV [Vreelandella zhanjiangensis]|uniref:type IV pilus assembly protein FimV n=1 Tax=Vreelandella zhanjiangensis TaxID=1121960 RepID=UPI0003A7C630|nr:FimV/HubP family polar landmark protein [Halomonas zhanjiangensis]